MRSFGLGLVKGLTSGFTRNIALEQEVRGAEDARIASLEDTIIEASLDPKKRVPKALGDMLKDAKGQLERRGRIDIFGREGPRLNLNMDKVATSLNGLDPSNMIRIGNYTFKGTDAYFETSVQKDDYARSNQFWMSLQNHLAKPENLKNFRLHFKDADELAALQKVFKNNKLNFLQGFTQTKSLRGKDGEIKSPVYTELLDNFNVGSVMDLYDGSKDSEDDAMALKTAYNNFKKQNEKLFGKLNKSKGNLFGQTLLFPYLKNEQKLAFAYNATKEEGKILTQLAKDYNYADVNHFLFDYATKFAPNKILEVETDGGLNEEQIKEGYGYLFHAVALNKFKVNDPALVEKEKIMEYLDDNFGAGDMGMRKKILAMSIAMPTPVRPGSDIERNGVLTFGQGRQAELASILKVTKDDYEKGYEAAIKARNDLQTLSGLISKTTTSDGLAREMYKLGFGIFGKGGQLSQFANMLAGRNVVNAEVDNAEAFKETLRKVFNKTDLDEFGQIEALKISLAFTLARAADPSGRLSNQDFEIQLRRLGAVGLFTNVFFQKAAIDTVLNETKDLVKSKSLIHSIYTKPAIGKSNVLSERERRIIYAAKNFHQLRKETKRVGGFGERGQFIFKSTDLNSSGETKFVPLDQSDPLFETHVLDTDTGEPVPKKNIQDGDKIGTI